MEVHKKALIITYYWPPAGGPGVQRWLKFAKYLPEFGVEPIIYCPENPSYPITDESLVDEVPNDIIVLKQPINEPYRFANFLSKSNTTQISSGVIPKQRKQTFIQKLMLYIRGNYFIPDARKNWINPSVSFLSEYIAKHNIDTIITTGPPHSLHLIGLQLKERNQITWFSDFRDPWTTIGYQKHLKLTETSKKRHKALEASVLKSADHIIVTSANTQKEFVSKTNRPVTVITNGYDVHGVSRPEKSVNFTLSHIGSLLSERNPKQLWLAISELLHENHSFSESFELQLFGVVSDDVIKALKNFGLENHFSLKGYVSHSEAIKAQMASQVLLLVEIDSEDTKVIIPGKLFEYMASHTPIIAVGPKDSDVEQIIKTTNTGTYFCYNEKDAIKSQILSYFEAYKTNSLSVNGIGIQQYSRKALTKSLADLLKD